jgi:hypothetical protein
MPTAAAHEVRDELYRLVPDDFQRELRDWVERRIQPADDLLWAILNNDLGTVVSYAASEGGAFLEARAVLMWLWNTAPRGSYGSPDACRAWSAQ